MTGFRCIAIETATTSTSVAASNGGRTEIAMLDDSGNTSRQVYHAIADVLARVELCVADIECVAYGCGPGSFTGVRVAASVAQAIAFTQQVPVCKVSSLAALAEVALSRNSSMPVAACLDARMGEVYMGIYERNASGQLEAIVDDSLLRPADFRFAPGTGQLLLAGNGWGAYPELLDNNPDFAAACDFDVWPDATATIALARLKFSAGDVVTSFAALPNYLRNKVTY